MSTLPLAPLSSEEAELVQAALQVQQRAYAPYSKFLVGAALRTPQGHIVSGCNVENASYGLGMCAERVAVGNLLAQGERQLTCIAVASLGGVTPCGACRQVLVEFGRDASVLLVDSQSQQLRGRWRVSELLPAAFLLKE